MSHFTLVEKIAISLVVFMIGFALLANRERVKSTLGVGTNYVPYGVNVLELSGKKFVVVNTGDSVAVCPFGEGEE